MHIETERCNKFSFRRAASRSRARTDGTNLNATAFAADLFFLAGERRSATRALPPDTGQRRFGCCR